MEEAKGSHKGEAEFELALHEEYEGENPAVVDAGLPSFCPALDVDDKAVYTCLPKSKSAKKVF